jgi:hypothetical protein
MRDSDTRRMLDLLTAIQVLTSYEDASDDPNGEACRRVAARLQRDYDRLAREALIRTLARRHGVSVVKARAAVAAHITTPALVYGVMDELRREAEEQAKRGATS